MLLRNHLKMGHVPARKSEALLETVMIQGFGGPRLPYCRQLCHQCNHALCEDQTVTVDGRGTHLVNGMKKIKVDSLKCFN